MRNMGSEEEAAKRRAEYMERLKKGGEIGRGKATETGAQPMKTRTKVIVSVVNIIFAIIYLYYQLDNLMWLGWIPWMPGFPGYAANVPPPA
ncbi:MAG: hypothetical protein QXJ75_03730 [Candidatus Bathyarchaeia archaeon]